MNLVPLGQGLPTEEVGIDGQLLPPLPAADHRPAQLPLEPAPPPGIGHAALVMKSVAGGQGGGNAPVQANYGAGPGPGFPGYLKSHGHGDPAAPAGDGQPIPLLLQVQFLEIAGLGLGQFHFQLGQALQGQIGSTGFGQELQPGSLVLGAVHLQGVPPPETLEPGVAGFLTRRNSSEIGFKSAVQAGKGAALYPPRESRHMGVVPAQFGQLPSLGLIADSDSSHLPSGAPMFQRGIVEDTLLGQNLVQLGIAGSRRVGPELEGLVEGLFCRHCCLSCDRWGALFGLSCESRGGKAPRSMRRPSEPRSVSAYASQSLPHQLSRLYPGFQAAKNHCMKLNAPVGTRAAEQVDIPLMIEMFHSAEPVLLMPVGTHWLAQFLRGHRPPDSLSIRPKLVAFHLQPGGGIAMKQIQSVGGGGAVRPTNALAPYTGWASALSDKVPFS